MIGGTINVARAIFDHPLFKGHPDRLYAWVWMLSAAAIKPTRVEVDGHVVHLQRGQLCYSIRFMADACGMSKSAFDRFLTRLKTGTGDGPMIGTASGTTGGTRCAIITICNYEKYQFGGETAGQAAGQRPGQAAGQAAGQERDKSGTNKEQGEQEEQEAAAVAREKPSDQDRASALLPRILEAAGIDVATDPRSVTGYWLGPAPRHEIQRWLALDLTDAEILAAVAEASARLDQPPRSLRYFAGALQDAAGRKAAPPLTPTRPAAQPQRRGGDQVSDIRGAMAAAAELERRRARGQ